MIQNIIQKMLAGAVVGAVGNIVKKYVVPQILDKKMSLQ